MVDFVPISIVEHAWFVIVVVVGCVSVNIPFKKTPRFFPCIAHFLLEPNIDSVITVKENKNKKSKSRLRRLWKLGGTAASE